MKDKFTGWKSVYAFTFRQSVGGAGFKITTVLMALIIIAAVVIASIVDAKPDKDDKLKQSPVKSVYIIDNSGFKAANYKEVLLQISEKQFVNTEFVTVTGEKDEDVIKKAGANSPESVVVIISAKAPEYELKAVIPENSKLSENDAEELLKQFSAAFESIKLMQAGLSMEQLSAVLKPSVVSYSKIGESTSEAARFVKLFAPMFFSLILYIMLLVYGQTVSKSVSTEKTSKLMDVLLVSVRPYALITGKVLAATSVALIQFVAWLASGIVGLYGGNAAARAIYPEYENSVITIINFLKDNIGETALTIPAVLMAVIFFCVGFLFYCVLAALAGCMVSKPEDVATTQTVSQMPIIISWMVSYFASLMDNQALVTAARYIPFTSPFLIPAELITGSTGLLQGAISLILLLIFTLLTIVFSGRIYKGLILYTGQKISFKTIGNVLKGDK